MESFVADSVEYLGTFSRYRPDPYPENAPLNAIWHRNEDGEDFWDVIEWNNPEPTGDHFIGITADNIVRTSVLDEDRIWDGDYSRRISFFPESPAGTMRCYRVKGLPNRGVDAPYNLLKWDGDLTFFTPPPVSVSPAQARIALHSAGLLGQVKQIAEDDPEIGIWFEYATAWDRANPHVSDLGAALGLTEAQIDDLFVTAAAINV
ncbi:hypothetical protein [Enterovirga aerilata]|uniref:Uncharacterized protein n=1 Tax=Enterovirga aerilata TaxID=2730920 RepID=A0A849IF58_9HYPH|nr:hypothetical protein [Enterovirga sp. DB1703]NNM74750.1 hypothetical protein [Enterovirga sp. DB1703]